MFKFMKLKLRHELEELKSIHRIEMTEKEAALIRLEKDLKKDNEIKLRETVSLLKLESEQKIKQMEIDKQRAIDKVKTDAALEINEAKADILKTHYEKLSAELAKLHSEGNITTKFTQDLALKMFESMPESRTRKTKITKLIKSADE